jgi:hypothetical protein
MSKHMQVCGHATQDQTCSVEEANFVPTLKDVQFFLTELLKYVCPDFMNEWISVCMYVRTYVCVWTDVESKECI